MKNNERAVVCTFPKRAVGIQAQRVFKIKNTGMSECVYMGGRELVQYGLHTKGHGKDVASRICYIRVTRSAHMKYTCQETARSSPRYQVFFFVGLVRISPCEIPKVFIDTYNRD